MSSTIKNIKYNLLTSAALLIANMLAVKNIFTILGVDIFGIIYFSEVISTLISLAFDKSLRFTVTREVSGKIDSNPGHVKMFVRSYLLFILALLCTLAFGLYNLAPFFVDNWISLTSLKPELAVEVFRVMTILATSSLLLSFFRSVLDGAQQMKLTNLIDVSSALVQRFGVCYLLDGGSGIQAVLAWYSSLTVLQLIFTALVINRVLGYQYLLPKYYGGTLKASASFSGSMLLAAFYNILQNSLDALVISKLLAVGYVGIYTTAKNIAGKTTIITGAISRAVYPSLCDPCINENQSAFVSRYKSIDLFVCATSVSTFTFGLFISTPLLSYLFGADIASQLFYPFLFLLLGQLMSSLVTVPWMYSIAVGRPEITAKANLLSLLVFSPVTPFMILEFGIEGAGLSFLFYNILYCSYVIPVIFRECLKLPLSLWYRNSLGLALAMLSPFLFFFAVLLLFNVWNIYLVILTYLFSACIALYILWKMMGAESRDKVLWLYQNMNA